MIAYTGRMPAGSAGEVNRAHPMSIEPALNDATYPVPFYGAAVVNNPSENDVRGVVAADGSSTPTISGFAVRPFPGQQAATTNYGAVAFGGVAPPAGVIDVLRSGYILCPVNGVPTKGSPVYVWVAASTGSHVQGGLEVTSSGSNTLTLDAKSFFNGPPDSNGVCELAFNL